MLILTRKRNEAVRIGDIRIVVTRISANHVRLGFETPAGCKAYREEIYTSVERANLMASAQDAAAIAELSKNEETDPGDALRTG